MVCLTLLGTMEKLLNETEKKAVTNAIGILARNLVTATTNVEEEVVEEEVVVVDEEVVVIDEEVVDPESATATNNELIKNTFEPLYEIGSKHYNTITELKKQLDGDIVKITNIIHFHIGIIKIINYMKEFIPTVIVLKKSITDQYMKLEKINILLNLDFEGKTEALILENILESKKLISIMENDIQKLTDLKIYESILNYISIAIN